MAARNPYDYPAPSRDLRLKGLTNLLELGQGEAQSARDQTHKNVAGSKSRRGIRSEKARTGSIRNLDKTRRSQDSKSAKLREGRTKLAPTLQQRESDKKTILAGSGSAEKSDMKHATNSTTANTLSASDHGKNRSTAVTTSSRKVQANQSGKAAASSGVTPVNQGGGKYAEKCHQNRNTTGAARKPQGNPKETPRKSQQNKSAGPKQTGEAPQLGQGGMHENTIVQSVRTQTMKTGQQTVGKPKVQKTGLPKEAAGLPPKSAQQSNSVAKCKLQTNTKPSSGNAQNTTKASQPVTTKSSSFPARKQGAALKPEGVEPMLEEISPAVLKWLTSLKLKNPLKYARLFEQHEVEFGDLVQLSDEQLREIGIVAVGTFNKVSAGIARLKKKKAAALNLKKEKKRATSAKLNGDDIGGEESPRAPPKLPRRPSSVAFPKPTLTSSARKATISSSRPTISSSGPKLSAAQKMRKVQKSMRREPSIQPRTSTRPSTSDHGGVAVPAVSLSLFAPSFTEDLPATQQQQSQPAKITSSTQRAKSPKVPKSMSGKKVNSSAGPTPIGYGITHVTGQEIQQRENSKKPLSPKHKQDFITTDKETLENHDQHKEKKIHQRPLSCSSEDRRGSKSSLQSFSFRPSTSSSTAQSKEASRSKESESSYKTLRKSFGVGPQSRGYRRFITSSGAVVRTTKQVLTAGEHAHETQALVADLQKEVDELKQGRAKLLEDEIVDAVEGKVNRLRRLEGKLEDPRWQFPVEAELDPQDVQIDHSSQLGEGSFSVVFPGMFHGMGVAVKEMKVTPKGQDLQYFLNEIGFLFHLRHPNVILFIGACINISPPIMVLELMQGGSLDDYIRSSEIIDRAAFFKISRDIALGMNFLHKHRPDPVLHLDLKPGNILIDKHGNAKLSDLGFAKLKISGDSHKFRGSPSWMSPEAIDPSFGPVTTKADVYSFGVILWQLVERSQPHQGLSTRQVIEYTKSGLRPEYLGKPPPKSLDSLIKKAWAQDQTARPSFATILKALQDMEVPKEWKSLFKQAGITKQDLNTIQSVRYVTDLMSSLVETTIPNDEANHRFVIPLPPPIPSSLLLPKTTAAKPLKKAGRRAKSPQRSTGSKRVQRPVAADLASAKRALKPALVNDKVKSLKNVAPEKVNSMAEVLRQAIGARRIALLQTNTEEGGNDDDGDDDCDDNDNNFDTDSDWSIDDLT